MINNQKLLDDLRLARVLCSDEFQRKAMTEAMDELNVLGEALDTVAKALALISTASIDDDDQRARDQHFQTLGRLAYEHAMKPHTRRVQS